MPIGARHRVAAERAEVLHAVVERVGDRARRRHRADRMAVAERLAHHDDVGHDALILERPEARAHAAESRLHFVGDADAAGRAHVLVHVRQISRRKDELAADARTRLGDEAGDAPRRAREARRRSRRPARRTSRRRADRSLECAAIVVGQRRDVHPVRRARAARVRRACTG